MKNINKKLAVTAIASLLLAMSAASQADAAVFVSVGAPVYPVPVMAAPVAYAPPVAYAALVAPAPVMMVGAYPAAYYYGGGPRYHYWHHEHWDGHRWH